MSLSRRSILTGAVASIFMPSIVKADSLMNLRGVLMDPWAITFNIPYKGINPFYIAESVFSYDNFGNRLPLSELRKTTVGWRAGYYHIRRLSKCDTVLWKTLDYHFKDIVNPIKSGIGGSSA